jgi:hypothetical protein
MFTGSLSVKLALSTGPVAIEAQPEVDGNTARAKAGREGLAIVVPEQLVSRFVQTPFGTADICREVTDQFTRQFVDVGTFEVIDPQASKVQNARAQHPADVDAAAVEYFPVHDQPPIARGPSAKAALVRRR